MANFNNLVNEQAQFPTSLQELRFNLVKSCSLVVNNSRQFLQPYGITPKQFAILIDLASCHPESRSIQDVREALADKMSDASRLIDRLEKKSFLDKFPSDFDRRSNRVRISKKGLTLLAKINHQREHLDRFINDRLDTKEVDQLNELLSRLK